MKRCLMFFFALLVSLNVFIFAGPGCHDEDRSEVEIIFSYQSEIPEYDFSSSDDSEKEMTLDSDSYYYLLLSDHGFSTLTLNDKKYFYNDVKISVDEFGYKHVYLKNNLDKSVPSKNLVFIDTFLNDKYVTEKIFMFDTKDMKKCFVPVSKIKDLPGSKYPGVNKINGIYFENLNASSYLTEGKLKYKPEGILEKYFNKNVQFVSYMSKSALPWVEGKADEGTGEYIEFDIVPGWITKNPDLYILNGYVNPEKPELFKQNNRIKKALIETNTGLKKTVEFRDQVEFTGIKLEENTSHVKITILEVYKGSKYNDTCLSAIDIYYGWWDK